MATLINTIIMFTNALSWLPLISKRVMSNKIIKAGAFIIPECSTPAESVKLSNGEWLHS